MKCMFKGNSEFWKSKKPQMTICGIFNQLKSLYTSQKQSRYKVTQPKLHRMRTFGRLGCTLHNNSFILDFPW